MIFLLANWKWIAGLAAAAVLGVLLGFSKLEIAELKAAAATTALDIQKQKTDAATIIAAAEKHAREIEAEHAEKNIQFEKEHADATNQINDRDRRIGKLIADAGGLRDKAARCGGGGTGNMSGSTAPSGIPPASAEGSGCRLSDELSERLRTDYRSAATNTEFARRCLAFAVSCSR